MNNVEQHDAHTAWAAGYGRIRHSAQTRSAIEAMASEFDGARVYDILHAADRVASAAMWLVVHETYARSVHLDGRVLRPDDFKSSPEGHTGGALNMVPAYVG